ncbi:MAG: 50S ribosomal protein L6 [Chloroflexi bacterium]|nr:50S ribosomal protein L6 [Chloroflexota bacterium]MBK6710354.1 50S ribosomal protein L6 [Chloroflexota bacterium]MBK7180063.1 50S ribosomal protein L6 [Chloroflexota bacterium]MBK7917722.1 50S ribosomal protein L6 [Chloroflexota bacterium]MBK8934784.1 50S ribosomal protein L6 [Chloroflexota bacterium]
MSRIGRSPVQIPDKVKIDVQDGNLVTVEGPKGKLTQALHPEMQIEMEEGVMMVKRPSDSQAHRSLHGLTRALLNNMVVGVSTGFSKTLQIEGVGYRAEMNGKVLVLNVGYSHPVNFDPPADVQFVVENRNKTIIVSGIDKQVVGEIAAQIRKQRPPEPYKGKGIRYNNEVVRRKAGKTGKV